MTDQQRTKLVEFIRRYLEGGNSRGKDTPLINDLNDIRDFVLENF